MLSRRRVIVAKGPKFINQREAMEKQLIKQAADAVERDLDQKFENGKYISLGCGEYEVDVQADVNPVILEEVIRRYTTGSDPWASVDYQAQPMGPIGDDYRYYFHFIK
jgi:hypothetical protein